MSWDSMEAIQDPDFPWPDVSEAIAFRANVYSKVEDVIRKMPNPCDQPVTMTSPYWALFMGFEHERIHLETSSVLMRQLPIDMVDEPKNWRLAPSYSSSDVASAPKNSLVTVPDTKTVVLGKPQDFPSFGWDNEYGSRTVHVPSFSASTFKVTNAEFLPFVLADGYTNIKWWISSEGDDEGWRWASYRNAKHPSFWVATSHKDLVKFHGGIPGNPYQKDDGHVLAGTGNEWKLRTVFRIIDMPWDWPCEVNYLEASAFMRWKAHNGNEERKAACNGGSYSLISYRFPTEAEFHVARGDPSFSKEATVGTDRSFAGDGFGDSKAEAEGNGKVALPACESVDEAGVVDVIMQPSAPGNTNWRFHSPTPVDFYGSSSTGFHDTHGNVWEWVEDHFAPLPGFSIHYIYDDFSAPCFDGWHTAIMGGSWASTGDLSSSFARYHFRRHFFQHLGFRYVKVETPEPYPGAATVTSLWTGLWGLSGDLSDGFGSLATRVSFVPELVSVSNASMYHTSLSQLASIAYEKHSTGGSTNTQLANVLHLGCAVGAGTFELCRFFKSVTGVDCNEPSIRHARILKHHGQFQFEQYQEGLLTDTVLARVPQGVDRARADFFVSDANDLTADAQSAGGKDGYDVVIVDDILTVMRQPLLFVRKVKNLVRKGGLVIIASDNDWKVEKTPTNGWLGGFKMNGEEMPTSRFLSFQLKNDFDLVESCDLTRLSRAHKRSFKLDVLEATIWRRL